jgi:hypothetical protein
MRNLPNWPQGATLRHGGGIFFYGVGLGFLILLPKEDDEFYQ